MLHLSALDLFVSWLATVLTFVFLGLLKQQYAKPPYDRSAAGTAGLFFGFVLTAILSFCTFVRLAAVVWRTS